MDQPDPARISGSIAPEISVRDSDPGLLDSPIRHGSDLFFAAIETTRMPMLVTDPRQPDNPIVFANRAFYSVTQYEPHEVLGRNCRFLQGAQTDRAVVREVREAIAARREVSVELMNYRKDGTSFWNALYVSPVFNADGELVYYFASQLDVSRRREAEASLAPLYDPKAERVRA